MGAGRDGHAPVTDGGDEEVYRRGEGTTRRSADGKVRTERGMRMVPTEVFRARGLLERARNVGLEEGTLDGRDVYVLRWNERSGPPLDHTYVEDILEFKTLPDTAANRELLKLG